jgi:hypothetical protein
MAVRLDAPIFQWLAVAERAVQNYESLKAQPPDHEKDPEERTVIKVRLKTKTAHAREQLTSSTPVEWDALLWRMVPPSCTKHVKDKRLWREEKFRAHLQR